MSHIFNPVILRAYDIRGIVNKNLNTDDAYAVARSIATIASQKKLPNNALVGYDGRLSSPNLTKSLIQGFIDSGFNVINLGLCPTPLLYMADKELNSSVSIIVTGSHNPSPYNGFKIMLQGKSFFGQDIIKLGEVSRSGKWIDGNGSFTNKDFSNNYVQRIIQDYNHNAKYKIIWDTGNGAMGAVLNKLISKLSGTHIIINEKVDGTFPSHHPDPTVESNLQQLKNNISKHLADFGIAFDGDGDRIGIVDSTGRTICGDQIMCILLKPILKKYPNAPILADVKASDVLFQQIEKLGGRGIMVPTGHSIVKSHMIKENAPFAGEMSSHIFFADNFYGHDDALYVAIRFINTIYEEKKSLKQIIDRLPRMINTPEIRIEVSENDKLNIIAKLKQDMLNKNADICDIDGIRVRTQYGWWLCRSSNTQNAITMRFESNNKQNLDNMISEVQKLVSQFNIKIDINNYA